MSIADNVRKIEKMHKQKHVSLVPYDIIEVIQNAASTVQKAFEGKKKITLRISSPKQVAAAADDRTAAVTTTSLTINAPVSTSAATPTAGSRVVVAADELVEEIFVNLFSNSAKYTDCDQVRIDIDIFENYFAEKKYWMINVSDYGSGIPDNLKQELFQRFHLRSKGSGLGLAIVKALVEQYNGKVWVADRVYGDYTKGTTFGMLLPALSDNTIT